MAEFIPQGDINLKNTYTIKNPSVLKSGDNISELTNDAGYSDVDWSVSQVKNIHADNYTDTDTTYTAGTGLTLTGTEFASTITQYTDALAVSAVATADDYIKNDAADVGVGLTLTGDNSTADTQYTAQVLYNTDATPPAASGFPIGTIYIQYTP